MMSRKDPASRLAPPTRSPSTSGSATNSSAFSGETFERMTRVNLIGAAYAIEAVLPSMIERGRGQIVGVSSLAAFRGFPGSAGYCATKAGLSALLEAKP